MTDAHANERPRASAARFWTGLWRRLAVADRRRLLAAAAVMVVAGALTAVLPLLIGGLVDRMLAHGAVTLSGAARQLAVIAALVIAAQLLQVMRRQLVHQVSTAYECETRSRTTRHLMRMDIATLRDGRDGALYGRTNRAVEGAVKLLILGAMDLLPALTLAIAALVVAFASNVEVAFAMSAVIPTGFALVWWQVTSQRNIRVSALRAKEDIDADTVEMLPAMEIVRTSGADRIIADRVEAACRRLRATELRHHRAMALFDAAKAINEGAWLLATLAVAVVVAARGSSAGQVAAYVLLYAGVTAPLRELHRIVDESAESAVQAQDLQEILDRPQDESFTPEGGPAGPVDPGCAVRMAGVGFTHRGRRIPALSGVTLQVRAGERVGLAGESGSGKSTLLKLIPRLLHGFDGHIALFGADVRFLDRARLGRLIGYVGQEPKLFAMSIRDNIALGAPDATAEEIVTAARRASIHEEIMRLPDGYDTISAERGDTLSGGQKQRICLARALLRTPPLLLLDEPTSALDAPSQVAVQKAIEDLQDVTMLMVAHRLSTLRSMDRILVFKDGRIVEQGPYEDLAAGGGFFTAMLNSEAA